MTGNNLKQILNLIPLRVRQDDDTLSTAETNVSKRKVQYMRIRTWIGKIQTKLIQAGVKLDEKNETHVTMVTLNDQSQGRTQNNSSESYQGYRGSKSQKQDNRRYRGNTDSNTITECGFCSLIQGKNVSQEYLSLDFNERHRNLSHRSRWANKCLPWLKLSFEDREKVLQNNDLYCKVCLRPLRPNTRGSSCSKGIHIRNPGSMDYVQLLNVTSTSLCAGHMKKKTKTNTRSSGNH